MHEAKLAKMEAEMKLVFQQKVQEKEAKLKQSEEELYARHREMKDALEKQRLDLDDKKRRLESGRPLTPDNKAAVSVPHISANVPRADFVLYSPKRRVASFVKRPVWCHLLSARKNSHLTCLFGLYIPCATPPYSVLAPGLIRYRTSTPCKRASVRLSIFFPLLPTPSHSLLPHGYTVVCLPDSF